MLLEAVAAALVGVAALLLVLSPLFSPPSRVPPAVEPLDPEETPRGVALTALKEIDFDRETGKLSDADYSFLKAKYTALALDALRAEEARAPDADRASCRTCGPRPEPDAIFCSTCGLRLSASEVTGPAPAETARVPSTIPIDPIRAG
jgi:hypothetical protein